MTPIEFGWPSKRHPASLEKGTSIDGKRFAQRILEGRFGHGSRTGNIKLDSGVGRRYRRHGASTGLEHLPGSTPRPGRATNVEACHRSCIRRNHSRSNIDATRDAGLRRGIHRRSLLHAEPASPRRTRSLDARAFRAQRSLAEVERGLEFRSLAVGRMTSFETSE